MLKAAVAALDAGRDEDALEALLAAWRASPNVALAEVIELLGAKLDARRSRPAGKTVKDKEAAWHAMAGQGRAADLGGLLATIAEVARAAPLEGRIAALAARPPDPRVAIKLATMIAEWPIPGSTGITSLQRALALIVACRDRRATAILEATVRQVTEEYGVSKQWIARALPQYLAQLHALPPDGEPPALLARAREAIAAAHLAAAPSATTASTLYANVYAHPDDDQARAVLADYLQQQGDPRGEFIALQLAGSKSRREAALLRTHARDWLGALEPVILKSGLKYERGFLARCGVKEPGWAVGRKLLEEPGWATIVELETAGWPEVGERAAALMPSLRRLTGVKTRMPSHPRLEAVVFGYTTADQIGHFAHVDAPALRSLAIERSYLEVAELAPLWPTQLASQLEELVLDVAQLETWFLPMHARLGGMLRFIRISSQDHSPWAYTMTVEGTLRCNYRWSSAPSYFDELADQLDRFPADMFRQVIVDVKVALPARLAAAVARFS